MKQNQFIFKIFIFLLGLSFLTIGKADDQSNARQFYEQGLKALNKGEYEDGLNNLEKALVYDSGNKNIISSLALGYNNYAIVLSRQENQLEKAIFNLEKSIQLSPDNKSYRYNLSQLYAQKAKIIYEKEKDYTRVIKLLHKALEYNNDNLTALEILGECYYLTQNLKPALEYLQRAQKLDPVSPALKQRIERAEQEMRREAELTHMAADYFEIRLTKKELPFDTFLIRDYLRLAYKEIGQNFNYFPKHTIVVLVYSQDEFRQYYSAPHWSAGAYDGKIHLPASTKNFTTNQLKGLIWHEYTHVVVSELTNNFCPVWINEGLAVWQGSRYDPIGLTELNQALKKGNLIPLAKLDEKFALDNPEKTIYLAYQQAYAALNFIIERYSFWHIQEMLSGLKNQKSMDEILKNIFSLTWLTLEQKWQEYLKIFMSLKK